MGKEALCMGHTWNVGGEFAFHLWPFVETPALSTIWLHEFLEGVRFILFEFNLKHFALFMYHLFEIRVGSRLLDPYLKLLALFINHVCKFWGVRTCLCAFWRSNSLSSTHFEVGPAVFNRNQLTFCLHATTKCHCVAISTAIALFWYIYNRSVWWIGIDVSKHRAIH